MRYDEIETFKHRITAQMNYIKGEITQLIHADYSDTIQNAKFKEERLFKFRKRVYKLQFLYNSLTKELK